MLDESLPASPQRLARMLAALVHRGPDDQGVFCRGPVGLGMRRLSIIDVAGGHQPIFSEDRSKVIVCNGEIYNYVELRADLIKRGHTFSTRTDTETIVHLYEEQGARCVEDLNGMFAFALWDSDRRQLLLARDRLGIKPLHYFVGRGMLLFASEINALMVNEEVGRELDSSAIDDYFTCFFIPGTRSVYKAVRKVPPAHTVVWRGGQATESRYWRVRYAPDSKPRPIEYYAEAYRAQLLRSVRMQLRSDVPLGVFLSGGLDSGSLVAAITRVANKPPATFTIAFEDPSYNEAPYALATARRYGTDHHVCHIRPEDMLGTGELISRFGEPFGPFTLVQAHAISNYSRGHITVALAGDGGDELFGGYQTYIASGMARRYLRIPGPLRRGVIAPLTRLVPVSDKLLSLDFRIREFVRGAEMFDRAGNMAWKIIFNEQEKRRLYSDEFLAGLGDHDAFRYARELQAFPDPATPLERYMYCDLSMFLPDCVLTCTDRMSMAVAQEVRVPILDHEMVEFSATVPDEYKLRGRRTKVLIRQAMKDWLPPEVLGKGKTGFTTPIPIWIRGPLQEYVRDILSPAALARTGILRADSAEGLLEEHISGRADHGRRIWAMVDFMLWYEKCYRGIHAPSGKT